MRWRLVLDPAPAEVPAFLRIARAVARDVERGRLRPGDRIPGSRALAADLGVSRNTVVAALSELFAEGWLRSTPRAGVFVAGDRPDQPGKPTDARAPFPPLPLLPFDPAPPRASAKYHLSAGIPDPRLVPKVELARAFRRAVDRDGERLFSYGPPEGHPRLRAAVAEMVATLRGVPASVDEVCITRGSQMALYLAAVATLRPGDRVAVEGLGYRPAWHALRFAGAEIVPVGVDGEGVSVDDLARIPNLRAAYVTPHHQYPTTVTLTAARRVALLDHARKSGIVLFEDDYDHEFHYAKRPALPLASTGRAAVVYVGTLSKVLAPGLRLGFVVAPRPVVARVAELRTVIDRQGDQPVEAGVAELFEEGEIQRHVRKMRGVYAKRRDALAAALEKHVGGVLRFAVPDGGISMWCEVARDVKLRPWLDRARARGVDVAEGRVYAFDERERRNVRFVFARYDERELEDAVRRLAKALAD